MYTLDFESDVRFPHAELNNVLEGVKSLAEKNLDENLNKIIQEGTRPCESTISVAHPLTTRGCFVHILYSVEC